MKNNTESEYSGFTELEDIKSINFVKLGINEITYIFLQHTSWKILVHSLNDENNLCHIYISLQRKNVSVEEYPLIHYKSCGLIKDLSDIYKLSE